MGYTKRTPRPVALDWTIALGGTAAGLAGLATAGEVRARAAETSEDVETDHIDAADDGGPRTWALALRPVETSPGLVGIEAGLAAGARTVFTLETRGLALAPTRAYGVALGVAIFPTHAAFHGFYVHPRVEWWRTVAGGTGRAATGVGALVGYEWTAPFGASLRLGGGLTYGTWLNVQPSSAPIVPVTGLLPEVDAAVGWVF